jgi:hypothetical protein
MFKNDGFTLHVTILGHLLVIYIYIYDYYFFLSKGFSNVDRDAL